MKKIAALFTSLTLSTAALSAQAEENNLNFTVTEGMIGAKMTAIDCYPIPARIPHDWRIPDEDQEYSGTDQRVRNILRGYCSHNETLQSFLAEHGNLNIEDLLDTDAHETAIKEAILAVPGLPENIIVPEERQQHSVGDITLKAIQALQDSAPEPYYRLSWNIHRMAHRIADPDTSSRSMAWLHNDIRMMKTEDIYNQDTIKQSAINVLLEASRYRPNHYSTILALRTAPEAERAEMNTTSREIAIQMARHTVEYVFVDRLGKHPALPKYYRELNSLLDRIEAAGDDIHKLERLHKRAYEIRLDLERRGFMMSYQQAAQSVAMASLVGEPGELSLTPQDTRSDLGWAALHNTYNTMRYAYIARSDYSYGKVRNQLESQSTQMLKTGLGLN